MKNPNHLPIILAMIAAGVGLRYVLNLMGLGEPVASIGGAVLSLLMISGLYYSSSLVWRIFAVLMVILLVGLLLVYRAFSNL